MSFLFSRWYIVNCSMTIWITEMANYFMNMIYLLASNNPFLCSRFLCEGGPGGCVLFCGCRQRLGDLTDHVVLVILTPQFLRFVVPACVWCSWICICHGWGGTDWLGFQDFVIGSTDPLHKKYRTILYSWFLLLRSLCRSNILSSAYLCAHFPLFLLRGSMPCKKLSDYIYSSVLAMK